MESTQVGNNKKILHFAYDSNTCTLCGAWKGQLGLEPTYQLYLTHLLQITAELKRVLKPSGTMWWNCADSYNGNPSNSKDSNLGNAEGLGELGRQQREEEAIATKSRMMLPERFAMRLIDEQGWTLRNDIVWNKPNHMPSSVKDRLSNGWEHIYLFTKAKKYYFNLDAIREEHKYPADVIRRVRQDAENGVRQWDKQTGTGKAMSLLQSMGADKDGNYNGQAIKDYETEGVQNPSDVKRRILDGYKTKMEEALERSGSYDDPLHSHALNIMGKNPGDVWTITTRPYREAHFATFPPDLPLRCMTAGCPKEVCSKCGKPKEDVVEVNRPEGYEQSLKETSDYELNIVRSAEINYRSPGSATNIRPLTTVMKMAMGTTRTIKGQAPTCACSAPFAPGVVFDPFAGSGTTLQVALESGLNAIGCEINANYIRLIEKRTNARERAKIGTCEYMLIKT